MKTFICITLSMFSVLAYANDNFAACGNNEQARLLAEMIIKDAEQQRSVIRCNKLLTKVATDKAQLMVKSGLVMHNLGGSPNERLREVNYQLPSYYGGAMSNQVEAIAGGYSDAEDVWDGFKNSFGHRQHLLGEIDFYREQDELGIAFVRKWESPHVEYWAVYLTKGFKKNQSNPFAGKKLPNKGTLILIEPSKLQIKPEVQQPN
ncbi:CAP domain-containing protein [Thalassotalea sp. SU-HH00458]|uniref:CAP domain-containing protein n=1 Tax=Thalassotalea sp. SU-HH00458 TaxID=3127657 RepID=UPI003108EC46